MQGPAGPMGPQGIPGTDHSAEIAELESAVERLQSVVGDLLVRVVVLEGKLS